jgi:ABC-2 type transport system permease protein
MKIILALIKKEFIGYFYSPIAYVFLFVFLLANVGSSFYLGNFLETNQASLQIFFNFHPWLYLFLVPAIGMRLWSEEKSVGTLELLFTLPIRIFDVVLAKFLAGILFILIALLLTFPMIITVAYLGRPDYGLIFAGYFGSFLLAGCYLAVSCATSAMTQNQVISFVISAIINFILLLLGWGVFQQSLFNIFPTAVVDIITFVSFGEHYRTISKGIIDSRSLIYFFSFIFFFLFLNQFFLEKNK